MPGESHQWGHVASVHLPNHDLLLRRGHAANVEGLWPAGARAHHGRQRHGAVLHLARPVELLLQDGGPVGDRQLVTVRQLLMECHGHPNCHEYLLLYAVEVN